MFGRLSLAVAVLPQPLLLCAALGPAAAPPTSSAAPAGVGAWTIGHAGPPDSETDPWLLKPRFHLGVPNPAGCAGTGFCAGCNDVNAMFKHRGVWHVFFQHILTPEYSGARPAAEYRTCWAHAATKDLVSWRTWGCVGDWDRTFGVAFDGAMLGLDGGGAPTLLFDGLEPGTALGVNASFVEVAAVPKNASDEWLREWRVLDGPPLWRSTTTGTNPSPGFALPASSGGNSSLRYTVAASYLSGHCSLLASATMRELKMVNPDFFTPGTVGRHCGNPNLLRLPGSTERWLLKYEGGRGSMFSLGSLANSAKGVQFVAATAPAAAVAFDFGNFQWAETMAPTADDPRGLLLGWVRSAQWLTGVHPPFGSGDACNPGWPAAPPAFMAESLLREVIYDERAQAVVTPPLRELKQLRTPQPLAVLGRMRLAAGTRRPILLAGADSDRSVGRQLEVLAFFERSSAQVAGHTFGVGVLESSRTNQTTDAFFTTGASNASSVKLSVDASRSGFLSSRCGSRLPPSRVAGNVKLLPDEHLLQLHVFLDRSVVEAFAMGGRGAATVSVRPNASATGLSVFSGGEVMLHNLTAWGVRSIFAGIDHEE
jgi:hypothetical protein